MAVFNQKSVSDMIKEFRKNWRALCNSERTTLCGADSMLLALQLSMAENNKQSQLLDFLSGKQYAVGDETDLSIPTSPTSKYNRDNEKVATSFIRTIELGGKGYAPPPSDPLRTHVKGLSNFINFIDKLDEILGEIPNPSIAGGQILSVIKMQLIKGQNSRDPFCKAIEEVAQDLDLRIKNIINSQEGVVALSTTDISPARMKQTLIRSQFACTYKDDYMISKDNWNNVNLASKPLCVLYMENDLSEGVNPSVGRSTIGTSFGNVHLDRSKNEKVSRKSTSQTGNKSSKRKQVDLDGENILCDNRNEPPQHKNAKIPKKSNDSQNRLYGKLAKVAKSNKCTAKDKLISGQAKLTQFFRL
ncbi:PCNA-interacting partner isoform X5 [Homo sapiens]|uniref:PCNA-interacting partner isoform X5 n=1 Tax=Homo sapiens TaxID=9606 RepID=UPI001FB167E8|nr:PCNA-interacting partner isoform X5 [Homo sapiens]XP_054228347.1 PCNA-interacting partner isoform X5 [Homo sapiens]